MKLIKSDYKVQQHQRRTIGIDLGTTYSCVGVWENDGVKIIANSKGNATTPSCVSFTKGERFVVGDSAKSRIGSNPTTTIYGAKRLIGRKFSDESVQSYIKQWPFKVVASNDGNDKPMIAVTHNGEDKQFSAEEISAIVLKKMKETAESYLGSKVTSAVITVPAHFNVPQRQATLAAAEVAGLKSNRLINEPVAAAVAYTFSHSQSQSSSKGGVGNNILVFDFGGGTLDVSLVRVCGSTFEVVAMDGDKDLGGDEINTRMVSHFVGVFKRKHGKDIGHDARAMARLWAACERAKRVLSKSFVTTIDIECLFETTDFFTIVTRSFLEKLSADLFDRSVDCATKCVTQTWHMKLTDINAVILAGGTSKIPKIQHMLQDTFKGSKIFEGKISPDEVVAYGATIISEMKDFEFSDFTTSTVGIEVYGGKLSVMIPKNTVLPTENSRVYTTVHDNQKAVRFSVYQGEHHEIEKNEYLNGFTLKGLPKARAKKPKFDVTFNINNAGVLTMSSKLRGTTNRKEISIVTTLTSQNTKQVIELRRMIDDSKKKSKETLHISNFVKKDKFKHYLKTYAGITMNSIRKQLKQIGFLNCFNIRD